MVSLSVPARSLALALAVLPAVAGCARAHAQAHPAGHAPQGTGTGTGAVAVAPRPRLPTLPDQAVVTASDGFHAAWDDGRAEMSGYDAVVPRYGELRRGELVLVYVTEPMDRRTWVKDDAVQAPDRVAVLKLNASLRFQTGIYPYSVLTSVFAPVDGYGGARFSPVKLTLSAQEWCGHVFQGVWPDTTGYVQQTFSYFASEGEFREEVPVPAETQYEDALWIQLRELDGPFAQGHDWSGSLVPSLWGTRRAHHPLRPVNATITRSLATVDNTPVHRFTVRYETFTRTLDVETTGAHRVLRSHTSDGEDLRLLRTARLPYWQLNHNADEGQRAALGLGPLNHLPPPGAPDGGTVGF